MDEDAEGILGANQALFRQVNEAIERGTWPGEASPIRFRCECARIGCSESIELPIVEYERVRQDPKRFLLIPGHEVPAVEAILESHPGYVVALKQDAAGAVAEETDPRD
jgi:hypothetical protein